MELEQGNLHLWVVDVQRPRPDASSLLSAEEVARANRFRFRRDRNSFVATRAALRELVAAYLSTAPRSVRFSYDAKGKPRVAGLSLNASRADDVALCAFARSGRVGVDVERMRATDDLAALARRFFTESENRSLAAAPDELVARFYSCWTRKEAFVKALGEGLSFGLGRVEVSVHPEPARLASIDGDAGAAAGWTMADVDAGSGYAGCVAVDSPDVNVVVRHWTAGVRPREESMLGRARHG